MYLGEYNGDGLRFDSTRTMERARGLGNDGWGFMQHLTWETRRPRPQAGHRRRLIRSRAARRPQHHDHEREPAAGPQRPESIRTVAAADRTVSVTLPRSPPRR
jgi:hypothetical protein